MGDAERPKLFKISFLVDVLDMKYLEHQCKKYNMTMSEVLRSIIHNNWFMDIVEDLKDVNSDDYE